MGNRRKKKETERKHNKKNKGAEKEGERLEKPSNDKVKCGSYAKPERQLTWN